MRIETINPANGEILTAYQFITNDKIQEQIELSHQAFLEWRVLTVQERVASIRNLVAVMEQEKQVCAELIVQEMGKPLQHAILELEKCILVANYYCENAEKFLSPVRVMSEYTASYVSYNPLGVILAVMPWNFPFWQVFRFMIPCLLAGNTVVLKHASIVSGCAQKIEALFEQADMPFPVFKHLLISSKQVEQVIAHPSVRGVSLTGGDEAGREIASLAGKYLKKAVIELGGNDPCIVLKDANLGTAAKSIVASRLRNTGQVCVATKRVIVEQEVKQDLLGLILKEVESYKMQDPMDPSSNLGPMARGDLRDKVHQQVLAMLADGANLVCGGYIPQGPGYYYPPTVIDQVSPDSLAYREELFGPIICLTTVDNVEDAIRCANATRFGLGGNIFTQDLKLGEDIAKNRLDAGLCFVNLPVSSDPRFPFGGVKDSGYGRELSHEGMLEFVNIKTVLVRE